MLRTVKEVSELTGVSVRTLHYYDKIGLLPPTAVTGAGYRLYDEGTLARLQSILLFRRLRFPLKEIAAIITSPRFDQKEALRQQITLLELERKQLDGLIHMARDILETGGNHMDFTAFDQGEAERYAQEVREKWGGTAAYKESRAKDPAGFEAANRRLMDIFTRLGGVKDFPPDSEEAQGLIEQLRREISDSFYRCTPEVLRELGRMYTADERFRENIDQAGGQGTARFAEQAIAAYCDRLN